MSTTNYGFGMPFKTSNISQTQFAQGRTLFLRASNNVPQVKQFKTQNQSRDTYGRLKQLTTKAASSSLTINRQVNN